MPRIILTDLVTKNQEIREAAKAKAKLDHHQKLDGEYDDFICFESISADFVDEITEVSKQFPEETIQYRIRISGELFMKYYNFKVKNGEIEELAPEFAFLLTCKLEGMINKVFGSSNKEKVLNAIQDKADRIALAMIDGSGLSIDSDSFSIDYGDKRLELKILATDIPQISSCRIYKKEEEIVRWDIMHREDGKGFYKEPVVFYNEKIIQKIT